MKILIAGGGTGGHIYIGIALAQELGRRSREMDFLFVGTEQGLESRIVPREGFRLEFIRSAGLKGIGGMKRFRNLALIPGSLRQSLRILGRYSPAVVVGLGGYSSGPILLTAWWKKQPSLVIEPNAYPGLTNRLLARFVDRVAIAFGEARTFFGDKAVLTGIPVRRQFRELPPRRRREGEITLLVYGGSQGSHALNQTVCAAMPGLKDQAPGLRWIHQTGEREWERVKAEYRKAGVEADVRPFLPNIYEEFGQADLILSRAGAGTVAELTVAGKASILVPFAAATDDHQMRNARALEKAGAARVLPEPEFTPATLTRAILAFLDRPEMLNEMENAARALARPDAAERIADLVWELAETAETGRRTR